MTDLPHCCPMGCPLQDRPTYGSLSPRLREVAEEGWERFLEGLADSEQQPGR
ncbi:hypothetical protein [Streptomyces sp. NBC_00096]|uniref:hypothetical protein n=1 Tax=Streptomyces sp. NBC_00096 TaxID=2975650 RepID=UPI003255FE64